MGLSRTDATTVLESLIGGETLYLQMHTGAPGTAGTANVGATPTRSAITFGAAASGAVACTGGDGWGSTVSETWSHFTLWTASSAGTLRWIGELAAPIGTGGAQVNINADDVILRLAA